MASRAAVILSFFFCISFFGLIGKYCYFFKKKKQHYFLAKMKKNCQSTLLTHPAAGPETGILFLVWPEPEFFYLVWPELSPFANWPPLAP